MDKEMIFQTVLAVISVLGAFGLTCALMAVLLPRLRKHKLNQPISIYAPKSHSAKGTTPTLGGLSFFLASTVLVILVSVAFIVFKRGTEILPLVFSFGLALCNAAIGFVDDYKKLVKHQNEGLKAWQKFLLQLIFAAIYLVLMIKFCAFGTVIHIPYLDLSLDLGIFTYVIAILLITGMINSTNLTDGVDGLLSSTAAVVSCFFLTASFALRDAALSIIPAVLLGSTLAFLIYNAHPAKVFMGDTGSLFIGAAFVGTAFMMKEPLIVLIAGGIYVIETASVILQVFSCKLIRLKLRKTRFFKRTPIHHHFEDSGFSENRIVVAFTLCSVFFCFLAYLGVM